jgi:hypothetical protein
MKKLIIIQVLIFTLLNCYFSYDINNEEEQKTLVYLDRLFLKYGQKNNSIYSNDLKIFLKRFFYSIVNEFEKGLNNNFTDQDKLNCIKSKANAFINIASHLRDDILINGTNFNKLSSLLITNLDICFTNNYLNHSINHSSNSYPKNKILSLDHFRMIKNNIFLISSEGKTFYFLQSFNY